MTSSRKLNMAKKVLTEPMRMLAALHAAAYMRWVETRTGKSPTAPETHRFITGLLDSEGFAYDPKEPATIEILALSLNLDTVHGFIKETTAFEKLDQGHHILSEGTSRPSRNFRALLSVRDIIAGVLVGLISDSWGGLLLTAIVWGFVAWGYIALLGGRADYKPGSVLFFGSAAVTRFIVWWTTAMGTSMIVGCIVYGVRRLLG